MENLSIEEAAARLGISIATARRWADSGRIVAAKSGRQWVVDGAQLPGRGKLAHNAGPGPYDLSKAVRQVRRTDLAELAVPDVLRYRDELDDEVGLLTAAQRLLEGARPDPAMEINVDKTSVFTRRMVGLRLADRVAWQAAIGAVADRVEARTPATVFSARLSSDERYFFKHGPTQWSLWRRDALEKLETGGEWLATTDLTAYFDTIRHRALISEVESLNVDSSIVSAVREMLRAWGLSDGVGLPQGPNASRLLGNLFLLPVDEAMLEEGWAYSRFQDDVFIVTRTRSDAVAAMRKFQDECRVRGLILGSAKTRLLHGEDAKDSLRDSAELAVADYWFQSPASNIAKKELKRVLRKALKSDTNIDVRKARFSLWRLAQLRDAAVIKQVLNRLPDLAPVASVVSAYLQPFIGRKNVVAGISDFLADPSRSYSAFLSTWILALMLEHPGPQPLAWSEQAFKRAKDRNQPAYLRAVAASVVGRGERPSHITWMKREIIYERDPIVLRGFAVGLFWAGQLDRATQKELTTRAPELGATVRYLRGRSRLPSLVFRDRWLEAVRSK